MFDLGSHLRDQCLHLFGKPLSLRVSIDNQRFQEENEKLADNSFMVMFKYAGGFKVFLHCSLLAPQGPAVARPYTLYGTEGSVIKNGGDPQCQRALQGMPANDPNHGKDDESNWGYLNTAQGSERIETEKGLYHGYFESVARGIHGDSQGTPYPTEEEGAELGAISLGGLLALPIAAYLPDKMGRKKAAMIAMTPLAVAYPLEVLPYHIRDNGHSIDNVATFVALFFNDYVNPIGMASLVWKFYIIYYVELVIQFLII
ncbi:hypothetical protein BZG36_00353 [Bifiguratus adelaidae]|uniref:GFO/IDH/MocA-like oxidoreductase domain-containing protein n=1 Tax=Bifiguratus adelaidae TaxID=1938954 RepID=A0A261Y7P9_9FUNG|nr:hypothetical protein BZG36_00353 [Bifiguratus adelaidae]